jgi:F-type H+-transporting ATPase subunit gamma
MTENDQRIHHLEGAVNHLQDKTEKLRQKSNHLRQEEITEEIEVILLGTGGSSRTGESRFREGGNSTEN